MRIWSILLIKSALNGVYILVEVSIYNPNILGLLVQQSFLWDEHKFTLLEMDISDDRLKSEWHSGPASNTLK